MAFDVNSLGGKLIDNQNLKKALENGGGGSSGGFVAKYTIGGSVEEPTAICDKTFAEIKAAVDGGTVPTFIVDQGDPLMGYLYASSYAFPPVGDELNVSAWQFFPMSGSIGAVAINFNHGSDETITVTITNVQ